MREDLDLINSRLRVSTNFGIVLRVADKEFYCGVIIQKGMVNPSANGC